jgi:hypothetical protein
VSRPRFEPNTFRFEELPYEPIYASQLSAVLLELRLKKKRRRKNVKLSLQQAVEAHRAMRI